ncbi:MAG: hybrid sensor histidine kinase/response regulator [Bacteroidales bacterium]|nr:hybrid sensor histidine kinase/response regulator [Bacteroidales bacterium]
MNTSVRQKSKILIVDDKQRNIQVLGSLLRQEDYVIGVATNGKQALEALKESNDYDLILLDVNMPVMDGFEACSAIRKHEGLREIPIIFLTALVDTENIIKGFEVGGQDYVTKPFNSKELLARVKTQLELKQGKDQLKQVNNWLEEKVAERTADLKVANEKLLQLDTAKSEFLNIISHEIRTPLNGIVGVLGLIGELELPEEISELLEIMELSADRLESFANQALDISLFNTKGKDALYLNLENLTELISDTVEKARKHAEKKNISIKQQSKTEQNQTMLDRGFIKKCFSHIIDNAIKFGNPDSQITIKIAPDHDDFIVSIENEGKSFPENYDVHAIKPFATKAHVDKNPGLSLFLCKQIIEAHEGEIDIMNTENGALVILKLPLQKP